MAQAQLDQKRKESRKKPYHQKKRIMALEEMLKDISHTPAGIPFQPENLVEEMTPEQLTKILMPPPPPDREFITDDGVGPGISEVMMNIENYAEQVNRLEDSSTAVTVDNIRNQSDYHLRIFVGNSTEPDAVSTNEAPKIPTTKERVIGILTNPVRQVKKAIERQEIFMLCFLVAMDLNWRTVVETMHLSFRTTDLVKLLWRQIMPQCYMSFIHHENVINLFSPHTSTFQNKCEIVKNYFDVEQNLSTICRVVQNNLELIRYIYSNVHAEVYYASDEGLKIERNMTQLLQSGGATNGKQKAIAAQSPTIIRPVQQQQNNIKVEEYLPNDFTKR